MRLIELLRNLFAKKNHVGNAIWDIFGINPSNVDVYVEATIHKSYKSGRDKNNERLEFLGDTVLDLIVADKLYRLYPLEDEGELTKLKSKIVSREHLLDISKKIQLYKKLPIKKQKALNPDYIMGNVLEALIGAIFIDKGFEKTSEIVNKMIDDNVSIQDLKNKVVDFKSKVYEWIQINRSSIRFDTISIGNNENSLYRSELYIDDTLVGYGEAKNKKIAQRSASEMAWESISSKNPV